MRSEAIFNGEIDTVVEAYGSRKYAVDILNSLALIDTVPAGHSRSEIELAFRLVLDDANLRLFTPDKVDMTTLMGMLLLQRKDESEAHQIIDGLRSQLQARTEQQ